MSLFVVLHTSFTPALDMPLQTFTGPADYACPS
jgi:hypothetical protein